MADAKISALTAAVALTGTEKVPVVQGTDTVRTTAQAIANLASGGTPGAPVHSVQFNNPLGTFAGSADFTWLSGTGLTIGGATETLGVVTPGVGGEHAALGNYGVIDNITLSPGDPVNAAIINEPIVLGLSDFKTGDLSGINLDSVAIYPGWRHTGVGAALTFLGLDVEPTINSDSTGPINSVGAMYFGPKAYAGAIGYLWGSYGQVTNNGATVGEGDGLASNVANNSGTIAQACALHAWANSGPGITASYGLLIEDQTGSGTTSENIHSVGATSLTNFEGSHYQGNYYETTEVTAPSAPPANGVRIYAQDNGAGKTKLMALFNTGAAQQIAIQP